MSDTRDNPRALQEDIFRAAVLLLVRFQDAEHLIMDAVELALEAHEEAMMETGPGLKLH